MQLWGFLLYKKQPGQSICHTQHIAVERRQIYQGTNQPLPDPECVKLEGIPGILKNVMACTHLNINGDAFCCDFVDPSITGIEKSINAHMIAAGQQRLGCDLYEGILI